MYPGTYNKNWLGSRYQYNIYTKNWLLWIIPFNFFNLKLNLLIKKYKLFKNVDILSVEIINYQWKLVLFDLGTFALVINYVVSTSVYDIVIYQ